jgi:ABC-2 type transport system permease protein
MTSGTTTQPFSPDAVQARRPGARAWITLIVAEAKMVVRDTAGLIIPVGMPLLILVMQMPMLSDVTTGTGHSAVEIYSLPVVFAMVVATVAVINMPSFLATYRKTKVLRRLAVTPASPAMVLVAQMVVSAVQVAVGIGLAYLVSVVFFDAGLPDRLLTAALVLIVTFAAMYGLGLVVASVAPTPNSAVAIGLVAFFGIAALGGMFGPVENLPDILAEIGVWLPFGAAVEAMQTAWVGGTVAWENWVSLLGSAVLGCAVAGALFRWE